jgi:hypothetical protein
MLRKIVRLMFVFMLFILISAQAQELDKHLKKRFDSIQPMDPYNYCKKMVSPEFAGRLTGHEGYTNAANWAADKFAQWGLKPISQKEGYLQSFPCPYTVVDSAKLALQLYIAKEGGDHSFKTINLQPGKDFLPLLFTDSGGNAAGIVFAGWGINAPELGYDDYSGLDVQGKFVLCFRGIPDRNELKFEKHDQHRFRMKTAKEKGALGIFYIYPEPIANPNGDWIKDFTPVIISEKIADLLFEEKNIKVVDLKKDLETYKKPLSFSLKSKVVYKVQSQHFPKGIGYNIAGYLEGSDPELKKQCLVIGGHFDHCGEHLGKLFAGANDNASGSAVVMDVAEVFSKLKNKPKRSVVFVLFGAEEMGLLGSNYFANHLPSQFEKVDGMFNFDMVGEGDGTSCGYSANSNKLKKIIETADKHVHTLTRTWEIKHVGVRSSDFAPFFLNGATCAAFFSNGPHLHYHKTGDTIYRINPDMLADIARLAFLSAYEWANR